MAGAAPIFAALGAEGPLSITRLTAGTNVTRQAVTKHLQVLAGAGLAFTLGLLLTELALR